MPSQRVRLVVLFGGRSAEHEVSCVTAASVLGAVDPARYEVVPVGITMDGRWLAAGDAVAELEAGARSLPVAGKEVDPLPAVLPDPGGAETTVVLPLLHGPLGEDGTVQGMLELAGVPYVGAGVLASALAMDKAMAKQVLGAAGLPQVRSLAFRDGDDVTAGDLPFPVFVKPANMGSSVGVSKVHDAAGLAAAAERAFAYDEWILVEEGVTAREVECAVLGSPDAPEASVLGEIKPKAEFYDFDDKYSGDGAELVIPADLPDDVVEEGRRLAIAAFTALRCDGLARVDFFLEEGGRGLLVNEVNTMPGFTPYSMYPRLWEASGVPYAELIDRLVRLALARHDRMSSRRGRSR